MSHKAKTEGDGICYCPDIKNKEMLGKNKHKLCGGRINGGMEHDGNNAG